MAQASGQMESEERLKICKTHQNPGKAIKNPDDDKRTPPGTSRLHPGTESHTPIPTPRRHLEKMETREKHVKEEKTGPVEI